MYGLVWFIQVCAPLVMALDAGGYEEAAGVRPRDDLVLSPPSGVGHQNVSINVYRKVLYNALGHLVTIIET